MKLYGKRLIILLGIGIILISGLLLLSKDLKTSPLNEREENNEGGVSLVINYGNGTTSSFEGKITQGMTAFDLLREKAAGANLTLKTKSYDMGIFVEAIGDKENGQGGNYWLYYVNNESPNVASDKKEIKAGDKVEFRFEKPSF